MSKRQLTNREQLRKMLRETEAGSLLHSELLAVQEVLEKTGSQVVAKLLKLLAVLTQREVQWFIARVLGTAKDQRVIRPLLRAALAPENSTHRCNFLWPLEKYDCTNYAEPLVKLLMSRLDCDEVVWACVEIIRAMKGPLKPTVARRLVRQLLAEVKIEMHPDNLTALHAFRLEAADKIMALYFNHTLHTFWGKWNNGLWPSANIC
jgi:hypothetical protein